MLPSVKCAALSCSYACLLACGGKQAEVPFGEIAKLDAIPFEAQVWNGLLYIEATDPNEDLAGSQVDTKGPHVVLLSVPTSGGVPTQVARIPAGDFRVGKPGTALVAKGQVAVMASDGSTKKLATVGEEASDPVWVDNGVVVLANVQRGTDCCDVVRVSLDGTTTTIGKLAGIGDARIVSDGDDSYMAEASTGETIRIDHTGAITPIGNPGGGTIACVALTAGHIWWARLADADREKFVIVAMPRSGGPPVTMVELKQPGVDCSGSAEELFFTEDNRIMAVAPGAKPRVVVKSSASEVRNVVVDKAKVFWAEPVGKRWSIRSANVR
jgi:hypothetical protein